MTDKLPPNLLKLFAPRPPLKYLPPLDKDPEKRVGAIVNGIAQFVPELRNYDSSYVPWKTAEEKRKEKAELRQKKAEESIAKGLENYDPNKDDKVQGDPFHTLFLSNLSYELTEEDLTQEFEIYGPIKHVSSQIKRHPMDINVASFLYTAKEVDLGTLGPKRNLVAMIHPAPAPAAIIIAGERVETDTKTAVDTIVEAAEAVVKNDQEVTATDMAAAETMMIEGSQKDLEAEAHGVIGIGTVVVGDGINRGTEVVEGIGMLSAVY
ncbi:hypothetical protein [Absidia glauca]|uniref:RRM domain-containing protein n=1 Tax=Absidia glauca TaxID=4829 RepID=A0A163JQI7_ABSGL|nr:hypothetical protein [Absidia glauca]